MEEYVESELSGIFRVKLVTKNIVRGSPETQFMHMRVKSNISLSPDTFLDKFKNYLQSKPFDSPNFSKVHLLAMKKIS